MDLEPLRGLALRAATAADSVIREWVDSGRDLQTQAKAHDDYVTAVDHASEAAITAVLHAGAPHISVVGEESGGDEAAAQASRNSRGKETAANNDFHPSAAGTLVTETTNAAATLTAINRNDLYWLVDPVDGTWNFARGLPIVSVSVGLMREGIPVVGVISAPLLGQTWSAAQGQGAHDHRGRRLQVHREKRNPGLVAGLPHASGANGPSNRARLRAMLNATLDLAERTRILGSACLDMLYVATGSIDGFFEPGLHPWDIAGVASIILEAGGIVTDWEGDASACYLSGDILAGSPWCHEWLLDQARSLAATPKPT